MKTGLIFLLLSGVVLVSCNFTRHFHLVNQLLTWSDAQRHCRTHFTDLATIQDSEQHHNAKAVAGSKVVWIGMLRDYQWSVPDEDVRLLLTGFTNWESGEIQGFKYVAISSNGKWNTMKANDQKPFFCYKGNTDTHFLVPELLKWDDARSRCRNLSAELSRIRNQEENAIMAEKLTNQGSAHTYNQAWIGLSRCPPRWSDGGRLSYAKWGEDPTELKIPWCTTVNMQNNGNWHKRPCTEKHHYLCYTDVPHIAARSVKIQLSGGSADLNHPAVRDSILQQLKQKLKEQDLRGVKLRWKIQPDGKVFHKKEEERAPPQWRMAGHNLNQPDH